MAKKEKTSSLIVHLTSHLNLHIALVGTLYDFANRIMSMVSSEIFNMWIFIIRSPPHRSQCPEIELIQRDGGSRHHRSG